MKNNSFYLSDEKNVDEALELCELSIDELESIVGRFTKNSQWAGKLRGEVCVDWNGVYIRHHFTKKVLWQKF